MREDAEASIPEMQDMLSRPVGVDFHPLVSKHCRCERCGTEKADWWMVVNGQRTCDRCIDS
jgi:transposase